MAFSGLVEAGCSVQWLFIPRIQKTGFSAGENNLGDLLKGSPFATFIKDLIDTRISVIGQTLPLGPHWPCSQTSPKPYPWPQCHYTMALGTTRGQLLWDEDSIFGHRNTECLAPF